MSRTVFLFGGLYLLAVAWFGPLPRLAGTSFAAHMGLHLILIAGAAPLIALGLSGTRIDARLAALGLLNPILASVVELVVVWTWHAPGLHDASWASTGVFVIEQASFLAVGLLLWLSAVGNAGRRERRAAIGVVGMLLTSMHMALLGVLLNLAPRPLYHHKGNAALADQQLGGLLMLVIGGTVYLIAGLWLLARVLRERPEPSGAGKLCECFGQDTSLAKQAINSGKAGRPP